MKRLIFRQRYEIKSPANLQTFTSFLINSLFAHYSHRPYYNNSSLSRTNQFISHSLDFTMYFFLVQLGDGFDIFSSWYFNSGFNNVSDCSSKRLWRYGRIELGRKQHIRRYCRVSTYSESISHFQSNKVFFSILRGLLLSMNHQHLIFFLHQCIFLHRFVKSLEIKTIQREKMKMKKKQTYEYRHPSLSSP